MTFKRRYNDDFILNTTLLLLCLAPILLSFMLLTDGKIMAFRFNAAIHKIDFPCLFKTATGYNCPVCGMTRSYTYMSSSNIVAAWSMNKAGVLLYIFCLIQLPYRAILLVKEKIPMQKYIKIFEAIFLIVIGILMLSGFVIQFINIG